MLFQRLAQGRLVIFDVLLRRFQRGDVRRGRRRRRAKEVLENKQPSFDGRSPVGVRRDHQCAAVSKHAAAHAVGRQRHSLHLRACHVGDPIKFGQFLVQERIVAIDKFCDRPIFMDNAAET